MISRQNPPLQKNQDTTLSGINLFFYSDAGEKEIFLFWKLSIDHRFAYLSRDVCEMIFL
jgi:hypothetical protein